MIGPLTGNMYTGQRSLTLMPLFLAGVLCNTWTVEYQQQHICAVKGSSVVIPCSLYHPDNRTVDRVMWGHVKPQSFTGRFISGSNVRKVATRFQYIGDKRRNCSLKIHHVDHNDEGKYIVRFMTNKKGRWPGRVSLSLKVVDLNISVTKTTKGATKEGDSVNLTCFNGCDGTHLSSAFAWFKNGEPTNEGRVLYLNNVSSANSGNYTCSLKTHAGTTSAVINIDVEYCPKNTSVSVRPSMEVDAGSSVTLICSSRANPPVENYTWYKIDDDNIVDIGHQHVFVSGDGGQYLCSAANKHGSQNSSVVTVKIKKYWATFTRDLLIISTVAVLLIVTTVIAIRRLSRKRKWAPKTDIQNTHHANWLTCENNQSQAGNQREGGATELIYATLDFKYKRTANMERPTDSHDDDDDDVIYSTVCRKQPLNPSYIEPP